MIPPMSFSGNNACRREDPIGDLLYGEVKDWRSRITASPVVRHVGFSNSIHTQSSPASHCSLVSD